MRLAGLAKTGTLCVAFCCLLDGQTPTDQTALQSWEDQAATLREDLTGGYLMAGYFHSLQLWLSIQNHSLRVDQTAKMDETVIRSREQPSPGATAPLLPVLDKLTAALDASDFEEAQKDAHLLEAEMRVVNKRHSKAALASSSQEDPYYALSDELNHALLKHSLAASVVLATQVQILDAKESHAPYMGTHWQNVYDINDAFGREAFVKGDYIAAGDYLLKAADTIGSPVLISFGPDFTLAQSLLNKGYRDVVVTFLNKCRLFWKDKNLDVWIAAIEEGKSPQLSRATITLR